MMFRSPSTVSAESPRTFVPPSLEFLQDTWYVTHSTLPMWKESRNVSITYTLLSEPKGAINDLVQYQPLDSDKQKKVEGVDTPDEDIPAAYNWRGRKLLKIASSHWEVLGYGEDEGGWMVTYFDKTLFTPAGIDIYANKRGGLSTRLIDEIRAEIDAIEDHEFKEQAAEIFAIKHNW